MTRGLSVLLALTAACCPEGRLRSAGIVDASEMDATRWREQLRPCDDAPPAAGMVQVVGHVDLSQGEWRSTLLGCTESRCCNETAPLGLGVITRTAGGQVAIRSIAAEARVGPSPWSFGGRLDCQWGPWKRALQRTTVRATGTLDDGTLSVSALCRVQ